MLAAQINPLPKSKPINGELPPYRAGCVGDSSVCADGGKTHRPAQWLRHASRRLAGAACQRHCGLTGGEISGPELPTNLENVQPLAINGETALQLNGGWTSGGKAGQGSLSGNVAWGQAVAGHLCWSRATICR
jgi:translocation and assembly module TamB